MLRAAYVGLGQAPSLDDVAVRDRVGNVVMLPGCFLCPVGTLQIERR